MSVRGHGEAVKVGECIDVSGGVWMLKLVQHDGTKKAHGFPLEFTLNLIGGGNDKAFVSGKA